MWVYSNDSSCPANPRIAYQQIVFFLSQELNSTWLIFWLYSISLRTALRCAGPEEPSVTSVPAFSARAIGTVLDWNYTTEPSSQACLNNGGRCNWPRGKMVSGTSGTASISTALIITHTQVYNFTCQRQAAKSFLQYLSVLPHSLFYALLLIPWYYHPPTSTHIMLPLHYFPCNYFFSHGTLSNFQQISSGNYYDSIEQLLLWILND